ncbi:MAG: Ig-like domain-containing protein [Helicobacteraceae bacterium]|jgi:hypothetical protein|nr:Ig-like domain-containing protein [Helicobacteraceae bacterium]
MPSIFYRPQKLLALIAFILITLISCDSSDAQKESGSSTSSRSSSFVTYDADEDALESIELPDIIALWKSQEYTFEPVFTPQDATNKELAWDCNDTSIVSIEQNGTITAKAIGEVTITAVTKVKGAIKGFFKCVGFLVWITAFLYIAPANVVGERLTRRTR